MLCLHSPPQLEERLADIRKAVEEKERRAGELEEELAMMTDTVKEFIFWVETQETAVDANGEERVSQASCEFLNNFSLLLCFAFLHTLDGSFPLEPRR